MTPTTEHSGWMPLPSPRSWRYWLLLIPGLIPLLPYATLNFTFIFVRDLPVGWVIVIMVAVAVATIAVIRLIIRLRFPQVRLNPSTSMLKAGRHEARYSDISSAQLVVFAHRKSRDLNLLLRADNGLRALILIGDGHEAALDAETTQLVQEMLRRSNITIPTSSDDPTGKFARYNFPDHLTKETAIDLVEHPPALGDELPIAPRI